MDSIVWFEPTSLDEAIALLQEYSARASLIAGGTDLIVKLIRKQVSPDAIIDLSRIPQLTEIQERCECIWLGTGVTFTKILRSSLINSLYPVLIDVAGKIGGVQIQNLGTLGGNICNAEPCADAAAACISLHAMVEIEGLGGKRKIPIEEVFESPGKTTLANTEVLTAVLLPRWSVRSGGAYEKLSLRKAMDQSIVGIGVSIGLSVDGDYCEEIGVGMATVAPVPMRGRQAEAILLGREVTASRIREAAEAASLEAQPRDSRKASAGYRREMIKVLTEIALMRAWEIARSQ